MAELVFALASSHSPQLSTPAEGWPARGERDKGNPMLYGTDGIHSDYEDLLARTDVNRIAKEITPDKMEQRHQRNQKGIAKLSGALYEANLDVLVMFGDDQQEYLQDDNMPAFCVYWGGELPVGGRGPEPGSGGPSLIGYSAEDRVVPAHAALGRHLIEFLMESEFDVGTSKYLNPDKGGQSKGSIGHAFGYVYHRLMTREVIPAVPFMVNTYYAPNQPTPKRCYTLGRAVREAIEAWPVEARVGVVASGGLSHFVVDEEIDQMALEGMKEHNLDKLSALPRERLNAGSSEIRNWISASGAAEHLEMELIDYVPCYRSPAGTGCGMGFATWS